MLLAGDAEVIRLSTELIRSNDLILLVLKKQSLMKHNHTTVSEKSKMLFILKFAVIYQVFNSFMKCML